MYIIMLGAQGTGKGTVAGLISKETNYPQISTGDIFRQNIKEKTELGIEADKYISQGNLVPDEITVPMIINRLSEDDAKNGAILDGFPRTIEQAEKLDKILSEKGKKVDLVIDLNSPKEEILDRIVTRRICPKCKAVYNTKLNKPKQEGICDICGSQLYQRDDDTVEKVENRIEVYKTQTKPLEEYYEKANKLMKIEVTEKTGTMAKEAAEQVIEKIKK